ncbi:hypothetical protein AAAC51_08095 [Priestia megaterium]
MTNLNEIFSIFAEQLNTNAQNVMEKNKQVALETQQTLTEAFNQMVATQQNSVTPESAMQGSIESNLMIEQLLKQQKAIQEQINELSNKSYEVQPTESEEPQVDTFTPSFTMNYTLEEQGSSTETYDLHININKPCDDCPFQNTCTIKGSKFNDNCGVTGMKEAALFAGKMEIHVLEDSSYKVYKNGLYIGDVAQVRENRPLLSKLDFYENQIVHLSTMLKPSSKNKNVDEYSTFTKLSVVVDGIEDIVQTNEFIEVTNDISETVIYPTEDQLTFQEDSSELNKEESFTASLTETNLTVNESKNTNSLLGEMVFPI